MTEPQNDTQNLYRAKKRGLIKRMLPRTLLARSLLILVIPILLIQVISAFVFFDRHWSKMTSRLAYAVAGEVAVIARAIEEEGSPETIRKVTGYVAQNLGLLVSFEPNAALDKSGMKPQHQVWENYVSRTLYHELRQQINRPTLITADFEEKWVEIYMQLENGILTVALPQRRLFSSSGYIFLIWMFSVSFLLLVIAILFMRNQIRPIRRLAVAAEWFGRGRDAANFKLEGAFEVRQAGQAFIDMQRRIKRQIEQRASMLAGVSHDLRTPLTRMKLQLEMMEDHPDAAAMKGDIAEMERMIEGYLDFVRGEGNEQATTVSVDDLLQQIAEQVQKEFKNVMIEVQAESIAMRLRIMAMQRAITNLVRNAARYGDHITMKAFVGENERMFISIEDNGPGLDEAEFEEVFKPFYRVDNSRNLDTGGVGLGLSIAMDIVHAHGGHIWLEKSRESGGLQVNIRLPL